MTKAAKPQALTQVTNVTQIKIRRARKKDAASLAALSGELGYPATSRQIVHRLRLLKPAARHAVLVAELPRRGLSGEIVGWIHVRRDDLLEVEPRAEINGLVVADRRRGLGVGARLLEAAEKWSRRRGCRAMHVRSNVLRERAHQFYERHGYEHYKTQKSFRKPL